MKMQFKDLKALKFAPQETTYMVSLLNSKEFKGVLGRYGRVGTRTLFPSHKVPSRLQLLTRFGDMLLRLTRHHGPTFVVKYLKALTVALQRFIGGRPLSSLREIEPDLPLPRLATCGLPTFIPLKERLELKKLTPSVVRWGLTLFNVYRIISIPGKLKLETITAPYGGKVEVLEQTSAGLLEYSKQFASLFTSSFNPKASLGLERIQKSSPSSSQSGMGFMMDADMGFGKTQFFQFANFGQFSLYYDWFELVKVVRKTAGVPLSGVKFGRDTVSPTPLGQLALKEEAAGKIRVFAMVDIWSQSVLKPLHDGMYDFFRLLPNDSTHNQDVGFARAKAKAVHYGHAGCYDLSAATDRLPIRLQIAILDSLFGHIPCSGHDTGITYGRAWAALLVDRDYLLPGDKKTSRPPMNLRYAVGQPMGAYSSGAMLNFCHHMLLQYLNFQVYGKLRGYDNYEVLGDDIVIFDKEIADRYLKLLEGDLDVKCNQSKSLIAPERPVIEFAKRICIGMDEVSAFSGRQIRSFDSLVGRPCVAADVVSRRGVKHPIRAFKAITGPQWGPISSTAYSLLSFAGVLVNRGLLHFSTVADLLVDPKVPLRRFGGRIIGNVRIGVLENGLVQYGAGRPLSTPVSKVQTLGRLLALNQAAARGYVEDYIVDRYRDIERNLKNHIDEMAKVVEAGNVHGMIPKEILQDLFFPGSRFRDSVKLVDLNTLSFDELVERADRLDQLIRELTFYKLPVKRKLMLEDSFKLLRLIEKSKRKGSLSFEILR